MKINKSARHAYKIARTQGARLRQSNHGVNQAKRRNGGSRKDNSAKFGLKTKADGFRR